MNPRVAEVITLELDYGTNPQLIADMCGHPLSVVIRTLRVHGHPDIADRLADAGKARAA
jgi:hypothetical protein